MKDSYLTYLVIYLMIVVGLVMFSRWLSSDYEDRMIRYSRQLSSQLEETPVEDHHFEVAPVKE